MNMKKLSSNVIYLFCIFLWRWSPPRVSGDLPLEFEVVLLRSEMYSWSKIQ